MSEWESPQDYRHRETDGVRQLAKAVASVAQKSRETTSNLMRAMGVRARPGMLSSTDFDGDGGRTNLGTMGWMLGAADGGPSFFILNGRLVIEELDAQAAALEAQDVIINGLIDNLEAAVADLASRVTFTSTIPSFNTGSLPNDSTFHNYGSGIPITIDVPTGKVVVTVGCAEVSLDSGGASVVGAATFGISGGVVASGVHTARAYLGTGLAVDTGTSVMLQRAFTVTPGTYTITGQMQAWASGTSTAAVNFGAPFLTVQVTG